MRTFVSTGPGSRARAAATTLVTRIGQSGDAGRLLRRGSRFTWRIAPRGVCSSLMRARSPARTRGRPGSAVRPLLQITPSRVTPSSNGFRPQAADGATSLEQVGPDPVVARFARRVHEDLEGRGGERDGGGGKPQRRLLRAVDEARAAHRREHPVQPEQLPGLVVQVDADGHDARGRRQEEHAIVRGEGVLRDSHDHGQRRPGQRPGQVERLRRLERGRTANDLLHLRALTHLHDEDDIERGGGEGEDVGEHLLLVPGRHAPRAEEGGVGPGAPERHVAVAGRRGRAGHVRHVDEPAALLAEVEAELQRRLGIVPGPRRLPVAKRGPGDGGRGRGTGEHEGAPSGGDQR